MRTCKSIITCIMACMCFMPIIAQTIDEEAMYIYHTDGSYNIYFRNEVSDMSIVTIDGVLFHVVQMGDNKHYYPLSQIQSISFVYPQEDTYKPSILEKEDSLTFGKYVDLGLPSGTKWASFNMGATKPEEYGRYYAWGETEEKRNYTWDSYIHCDGTFDTCHDLGSDISGTEYDVAHVKWGGDWRMPTKEEFEELKRYCTLQRMTINGVIGYLLTSKINGNSIFFPFAGYRWYEDLNGADGQGYYWSSTQHPQRLYDAYYFYLYFIEDNHRYNGYSVRPVVSGTPNVVLSVNEMRINVRETKIVEVYGNGHYIVECNNPQIATVSISGTTVEIKGIDVGEATITVTDTTFGQTATITVCVVVPEAIELGLPSGTKWASWNVGATKPEEYGGYYAWGETEEKDYYDWSNYSHCDGSKDTCHDLGYDISGTEYDVAHVKWGGFWQMPTSHEFKELLDNCTSECITLNGVNGYKFTSKINGNSIFLPAAGEKFDHQNDYAGFYGFYWSSTTYSGSIEYSANFFYFYYQDDGFMHYDIFCDGLSVRPVYKIPDLVLSSYEVTTNIGEEIKVNLQGSGDYTAECNDPQVATATIIGTSVVIKGIDVGETTIKITDTMSGQTAIIIVHVQNWSDWDLWNSTGTATYTYVNFWGGDDPGLPFVYRQNRTSPNLYQFKLSNWGNGVDLLIEYDEETDHVICPPQFTGYTHSTYGDVYVTDLANYRIVSGKDIGGESSGYGTFDKEEGIFTIPLAYYVSAGSFGYDPEYIYIDGVARKDYSINLSYVDVLTDAENQVFVIGDLELGPDATNVKAVVVSQRDNVEDVANALATGEMEGVNVEAGRIQVPIPKGIEGKIQLVVVVIVDGVAKEVSTAKFSYYRGENWTSLGKGVYTDNLLCTPFGLDPITYEVEVMEYKNTGLYRLIYPYGEIYPYNDEGEWDTSASYDIEIDATDPDGVLLYEQPTGAYWRSGIMSIQSVGAYYNVVRGYDLATLKDAGYLGTLKDGVITLPVIERELSDGSKGQYQGFLSMGGESYYTGSAGEFKLILPGSPALNVAKKRIDKKPLHNGPKQFNGIPVERLAKQKLLKNPF